MKYLEKTLDANQYRAISNKEEGKFCSIKMINNWENNWAIALNNNNLLQIVEDNLLDSHVKAG